MLTTRRIAAGLGAATLLPLLLAAPQASAAPPTTDPIVAARDGAGWVARQVNAQGFVPSATDATKPDLNLTANAVLALAAAKVGDAQAAAALAYLGSHVDAYVKATDGSDKPAPLATLILVAVATGKDPHTFGGGDLVTRLVATGRTSGTDAGLFGAQDPTFDAAFRQGLSLTALAAAGTTDAQATGWLQRQQCASGGWTAYRADTTQACPAPDPVNFTGPDTNSTALAVEGLAALHVTPTTDPLAFLASAQGSDAGWAFIGGAAQASDANSTGLVIQALLASNASPTDARFAKAGRTPYAALLGFQLGCDAAPADRGAFAFQPDAKGKLSANGLATVQAVPAAAGVAFPLPATTLGADVPAIVCPAAAPTTTSTTAAAVAPAAANRNTTAATRTTLPRTGGIGRAPWDTNGLTLLGAGLIAAGGLAVAVASSRRRGGASS